MDIQKQLSSYLNQATKRSFYGYVDAEQRQRILFKTIYFCQQGAKLITPRTNNLEKLFRHSPNYLDEKLMLKLIVTDTSLKLNTKIGNFRAIDGRSTLLAGILSHSYYHHDFSEFFTQRIDEIKRDDSLTNVLNEQIGTFLTFHPQLHRTFIDAGFYTNQTLVKPVKGEMCTTFQASLKGLHGSVEKLKETKLLDTLQPDDRENINFFLAHSAVKNLKDRHYKFENFDSFKQLITNTLSIRQYFPQVETSLFLQGFKKSFKESLEQDSFLDRLNPRCTDDEFETACFTTKNFPHLIKNVERFPFFSTEMKREIHQIVLTEIDDFLTGRGVPDKYRAIITQDLLNVNIDDVQNTKKMKRKL